RQEDVQAGAEADEAEAFAGIDRFGGFCPADDATCDEPGDLHDGDVAVAALDHHAVAFVVFARLVEPGIDELAGTVLDVGYLAANGGPVDVAVEDVHEDRD